MPNDTTTASEAAIEEVRTLHRDLLDAWNTQNAKAFAANFAIDGTMIGFDGSTVSGQRQIEGHVGGVFADHQTATYVSLVKEVRTLTDDGSQSVVLLRAAVGMVPPGQSDIHPDVNAIQTLVAVRKDHDWEVALFQNTPAVFHGRPEEQQRLTHELRKELNR